MAVIIVTLTYTVNATNYYVSSSGNDSNAGTSESAPWKTLDKVNSFTPKAGDQILFKRGDEWTGSITVNASGTSSSQIIYGAYGTGNKPKIYGSEKITGWTQHSGNIYKATFNKTINQLFINDLRAKAARYPNTGYALTTTINSATTFTCDALNGTINYTGATWVGRTVAYATVTLNVVSSSGKTLTLSEAPYASLNTNEGFILVNKLEFLDSPGEWYYDNSSKTVYFWTPNGDSPANYTVSGSTIDNGVVVSSKNYVKIQELEILNYKKYGITLSGSYITIDNNIVSNPDARGIDIALGSYCTISNNTVSGANHSGIFTYSSNSIISDNQVNDIFLLNNIGISGGGAWYMGSGISVEGNDNTIKYNRTLNTGYNGICFYKRNIIEYNYVKNAVLTKDDGGGIYTAAAGTYPNAPTAGSIIRNNIVDGVFGTLEGWDKWIYRGGHGIFLDENSGKVTIENNTVVNGSHSCIFIRTSFDETVRNNTLMSARRVFLVGTDYGGSKFTNNIVYALNRDIDNKDIQWLVSNYKGPDILMNYNTYLSHYNSTNVFRIDEVTNYSFEGWKAATGQDANSTIDVTRFVNGETEEIFYNDTKQTKTFNLGNSVYKDIYGQQVPQTFVLAPFTSKILIKTKAIVTVDNTLPTISSFSIPTTSASLIVPVNSFSASDNFAVTGYKITETSNAPNANDAGWNTIAPSSFTFVSEGTKTLYAWAKDATGNVSKSVSAQVVISLLDNYSGIVGNVNISNLSSTSPNRRATPVTFNSAAVIESISIYHNGGKGGILMGVYADQAGEPSIQLGATAITLINSTEGWQKVSLKSPVVVNAGQKVWLSWVFENNPGIRYSVGTPSRAQSTQTWTSGMPSTFGTSDFGDYIYSIYCTSVKPNLEVSTKSISLEDGSGVSGTLNISSNVSWSITENIDWLDVSKLSGSNSETITVTANSANSEINPRTATLLVVGQTGISQTITITQKNQTLLNNTQGTLEVFTLSSTTENQRAIPVTFNENGEINSITIYHNGGTGRVLLGVFSDNNNSPNVQLGITSATTINTIAGWQTINLKNLVPVVSGQTVWLSWVFEKNPGIRYSIGKPGRAESTATWSAGMPLTFVAPTFSDYNYSIYCSYTPGLKEVLSGNAEIYKEVSTAPNRRAISVTPTETGTIESITIYHEGGTGNVLLGVYSDNNGSPLNLLGRTSSTAINTMQGWQTISMSSPVPVIAGQTIWLSWVFQNNPGTRYTIGAPGRVQSEDTWSVGMPDKFGLSSNTTYEYSVYCSIKPGISASVNGNNIVYNETTTEPFMRATPVTFDEGGTISSITIYHNGGTGNMKLGIYSDQSGSPFSLLGVTPSTSINSNEGWQTVLLESPVSVNKGQSVWLSWVFQNNPGIRYSIGKPGRAQSTAVWSADMPANFGSASIADYNYSVYCTYIPNNTILKGAEIPEVEDLVIEETQEILVESISESILLFDNSLIQTQEIDFKLYPNPAKSFVNIDFLFLPETVTTIEIIDGFGRTVEKKLAESTSNRIETNQLTRGMYFVRITNTNNTQVKKLIIE
jgi:parallel beta-helix repeat protein